MNCSESKLTVIFGIRMIFFTQCTNFHNSRARCSWKQATAYGPKQWWNFRGNPPEYDMNRWISPVRWHFSICYNSIFGISPDDLSAKPDDFLWITHCQVYRYTPVWINSTYMHICVSGVCRVLMGKLVYKSVRIIRFLGVISIQTKLFPLAAQQQLV